VSLSCNQYVVYSATYQVPTFYFSVHDANGTPLFVDDLVKTSLFRSNIFENTTSTSFAVTQRANVCPMLSQGEHPTLGTPCWYLHPCETVNAVDEIMVELARESPASWTETRRLVRWMEAWFMVLSCAVDL
ncbi:hypothetical protein FISHEDRAFT_11710, partial [Fistulina hepatica ATCC 64428]